jgi:hypothetical protein
MTFRGGFFQGLLFPQGLFQPFPEYIKLKFRTGDTGVPGPAGGGVLRIPGYKKQLPDQGLRSLGDGAEDPAPGRDLPPGQDRKTRSRGGFFYYFYRQTAEFFRFLILPGTGKKHQTRTIGAGDGEGGNYLFIIIMGYLHKNPGTIPGFIIRAFRAPVFHPFQNFQAPF